jgi:hypothetical protein
MKLRSTALLLGLVILASAAFAQMEMPKPGPELEKLNYFLGNWTTEGDAKPGPMGPGGKMTSTGKAEWMEGKYFVMMHEKFSGAMGNGTAVAFMGYDPDQKMYTYNEFNSMGEAVKSTGTVEGDTWTFTDTQKMGGKMINGRYTMKILSPTSYTFKFEMQPEGGEWMTAMEGKATKK